MRRRRNVPGSRPPPGAPGFVVQWHWTHRPHYDLHLEVEGRLACWMLPKGPAGDPHVRRFALRTPDRELEYGRFEGVIPKGEPGAGVVMVWDLGTYEPYPPAGLTIEQWLARGLLKLHLHGEKLHGLWQLVRWQATPGTPETWVLLKLRDRHARPGLDLEKEAWSVLTGRTVGRIAAEAGGGLPPGVPSPDPPTVPLAEGAGAPGRGSVGPSPPWFSRDGWAGRPGRRPLRPDRSPRQWCRDAPGRSRDRPRGPDRSLFRRPSS